VVTARYPVDRTRVLLTGMSDGATYAFLAGLRDGAPFTIWRRRAACSPGAARAGLSHARRDPADLPRHGELDWMFPVETGQLARDVLTAPAPGSSSADRGPLARVSARRDPRILDWLVQA